MGQHHFNLLVESTQWDPKSSKFWGGFTALGKQWLLTVIDQQRAMVQRGIVRKAQEDRPFHARWWVVAPCASLTLGCCPLTRSARPIRPLQRWWRRFVGGGGGCMLVKSVRFNPMFYLALQSVAFVVGFLGRLLFD